MIIKSFGRLQAITVTHFKTLVYTFLGFFLTTKRGKRLWNLIFGEKERFGVLSLFYVSGADG